MKIRILTILSLLSCCISRGAITFDWDNATITGSSGSVVAGGITMDFEVSRFGSAGGDAPSVSSGFLVYNSSNDFNGNTPSTDTLDNYSRMIINFSERVTLVGNQFTLLDVDDVDGVSDSWQDFVSVRALQLSPTVEATETYTVTNASNQQVVSDYYGNEGVRAFNQFNAAPLGSTAGNVDVGVDMGLDRIVIFYAQGEGGDDGASHSILLQDFAVVPELSSLGLSALALVCALGGRWIFRKR